MTVGGRRLVRRVRQRVVTKFLCSVPSIVVNGLLVRGSSMVTPSRGRSVSLPSPASGSGNRMVVGRPGPRVC